MNEKSSEVPSSKSKAKSSIKEKTTDAIKSSSSSHTQYYKKEKLGRIFKKVSSAEYLGISESISGSSDTFHCVHGPEGKKYSEKGRLKRNLLKELDPIPIDPTWNEACPPVHGWEVARILEFLVKDPVGGKQMDRLRIHIKDFAAISHRGYRVDVLSSLCTILDYLVETFPSQPDLKEYFGILMKNTDKPIILTASSDVLTNFETVKDYIGYLGYLLICLVDDELFDMVSRALIWQLSFTGPSRKCDLKICYKLLAAAPVLYQTVVRMLALATPHRFPTFLKLALILACDSSDNCIEMIKENIIENILSRFNPFFPEAMPPYETTPADPQDINIKLGDSTVHISTTLSVLLVLLTSLYRHLEENPIFRTLIPVPEYDAQRCFLWAYRYECRARDHRHERTALTVIAHVLLKCFGDRLAAFSTLLMPDIMTLSVLTEVSPREGWTRTVKINTGQKDVYFKKMLIHLSVEFLNTFHYNKFMVESQFWLMGLTYLLDPDQFPLRARWSPPLYEELRKTALQALVLTLRHVTPKLTSQYRLIKRMMWYTEWYIVCPYEVPVLYWCVRVINVSIYHRNDPQRMASLTDLYNSHGIIIMLDLCYKLIWQRDPPVEKIQAVIAQCLRLLTSAAVLNKDLFCCIYPHLRWPDSMSFLANKMLDAVLLTLERYFIVSDRWLISLLNFIWEAVVWNNDFREPFIENEGVYKLLDIITLTKAPVQCMALAILCDILRSGGGIGQVVTWRAKISASNTHPNVVKRGSTIANLLASVFRDECVVTGVQLDHNGVIQNLNTPLMAKAVRKEMESADFRGDKSQRTSFTIAAADVCGSRLSKVYCILHLLSEDLAEKVSLADEAYNLYKNIKLPPEDEVILILSSHYLSLKLNETWVEIKCQYPEFLGQDRELLEEFLQLNEGWSKEIKRQQEYVVKRHIKSDLEEENSLYTFLGRVRLNIALEALHEVRTVARSTDRTRVVHAMLQEAVHAHNKRLLAEMNLGEPVIRTFVPPLDDQNVTGQHVRVAAIDPKRKSKI